MKVEKSEQAITSKAFNNLSVGTVYDVLSATGVGFWIRDDSGNTEFYNKDWLNVVPEFAETPEEYTGASVSYYTAEVVSPTNPDSEPYTAECNDIIEALGMTFAEGNAFKAIWRSCAARKFGKAKKGYDNGLYDAEKVVFFGERMVVCAKAAVADNEKGSDENDAQGSR